MGDEIAMMNSILSETIEFCPDNLRIKAISFKAGENIILQGDEQDVVYLLVEGRVRIYKLFPDGGTFTVLMAEKGEFLGEIEAFTTSVALNMADAATDCELLRLYRGDFLRLVYRNAKLAIKLLTFSNERLYNFNSYLLNFKHLSKAEMFWVVVKSMDENTRNITKSELTETLNASARTVNRLVVLGVSAGILDEEKGNIIVVDKEKLYLMVEKIINKVKV